jgi:autotransporter-associated beta strand protein
VAGNLFSSRKLFGQRRAKLGHGRRLSFEQLERRDMLSGTWTQLANASPAGNGTMELLTNGSVLMTNGGNEWSILTPNSSGSYVNGTWTRVANADYTRLYDATDVLPNGDVFVAGGEYGTGSNTGEVYNPLTNTWIQLPSQPYGSFIDSSSMLVSGGTLNGDVLITPVFPSQSGYTTVFYPSTDTWGQGPKLYRGGNADEQNFVELADGSILTCDGDGTSERYIPSLDKWVNDGTIPVDLFDSLGECGVPALLNNGQVIYFGSPSVTAIYTPSGTSSPGTWTAGPAIPNSGSGSAQGSDDSPTDVLRDGTVLVAVGPVDSYNGPITFYIYNPATNSFSSAGAPSVSAPPYECRMLSLPDGNVLVNAAGKIYEFNPGDSDSATTAADAPTITGIAQNSNGSFLLTGTELTGINQGAYYGDDAQMDSNYPIVRLVNGSNVYYATTNNWSDLGIFSGSASETVDFKLPLGIPAGTYSVYAVANGIASSPTSLTLPATSDTGPTVATAASVSATAVTGTSVNLSVLGADPLGASSLTYTWTTATTSNNIQRPSFSDNGDNTAQNVTATFHQAGTYTFTATITDTAGLSTTSSVTVTVSQTYSSVTVTPALASIGGGGTEQFSASAFDQFGIALTSQPAFSWSVASGTGSVNSSGLYTAASSGTLATISATGTKSSTTLSGTGQVGVVSSPWNSTDIGSVGLAGTAYDNGTTFTVEGSGSDIWGTSDEFHFVYQTLTGDGVIIAQVASLTDTNGWAKVGVMFRNSLSDSDQYALESITPGNGSAFQYRTTSGDDAAGTSGDSGPAAPYWVKLVWQGDTITGYRSSDGNTWVEDGSETIAFTNSTIYVGLEADSHDNSALNTSTFDHVALLAGGDSAPTVAQAAAANPLTGTTVALSALGADANGQSYLTYTWTATTVPSGATAPTYSANGSNAAQNTTATFSASGTYVFQVTITNEYGLTVTSSVTVVLGQTPTVATPASATPSPVTGTTTNLSVLGAYQGGEANLTYTWSSSGPASVSYSVNGTNAAKNTTATFTEAGTYSFTATISAPGGQSTTSTVSVTVDRTLTTVVISPSSATLGSDATQQFTASAFDQFGIRMVTHPAFSFALASGVGGINSETGSYTASYASGAATVTATSGSVTSNAASVTVTDAPPTVATPANAMPSPVTGTTTAISVLGADSDGGGESNLTYTWAVTGTPPAAVSFSANGTNAAKNTTATFTAAGNYTFQVTITDMGGESTTSSVNVTVNQTPTSVAVGPATANITAGGQQQFTVSVQDQFGQPIGNPPVTWSLTGPGMLSSSGLYSPAYAPGTATVQATSGSLVGTASVTVTGQAEWNAPVDASWGASGSWADSVTGAAIAAPGVRGIAGDTVLFASASDGTVTLDGASPALAGITFDNSTTSYTIAQGTGGSVTLQASGQATVSVLAGTHAISAPVGLLSNTSFSIAAGSSLTVSGDISGDGSLTESGGGVLRLTGANSDAGGTTVLSGKLIVIGADSLADGSSLMIGNPNYFTAVTPAASTTAAAASVQPTSPAVSPATPPPAPKHAAAARVLGHAAAATPAWLRAASAAAWLVPSFAANAGVGPIGGTVDDYTGRARDMIFFEYGLLADPSRSV